MMVEDKRKPAIIDLPSRLGTLPPQQYTRVNVVKTVEIGENSKWTRDRIIKDMPSDQEIDGIPIREVALKVMVMSKEERAIWVREDRDYEYVIEGEKFDSGDIDYIMKPNGIYRQKTKVRQDKQGNQQTTCTSHPLWQWDSFKVHRVMFQETDHSYREWYDFSIEGKAFRDKEMDAMRDVVAGRALIKSAYKQLFNRFILKYCEGECVPRILVVPVMGFTEDGWRLPPDFHVNASTGTQQKIRSNIEAMTCLPCDAETPVKVKALYNAIASKDKDIVFSIGTVFPFLYALRSKLDLMPWFALGSLTGGTGKSSLGKLITHFWWNNHDASDKKVPVLNKDNLRSDSRAGEYLTASTFPVVVDDCEDLEDNVKSVLKTYFTQETTFMRKDKDQSVKIDKTYCAPVMFTWNKPPSMVLEQAFLTRGLFIPVNDRMNQETLAAFKAAYDRIRPGEIGRAVYEATRDWTLETLLELYESIVVRGFDGQQLRAKTIVKLIHLGALLCERFFGFKLDVSRLSDLLNETMGIVQDNLIEMVEIHVQEGSREKDQWPRWITRRIFTREQHGEIAGYYFDTGNLQDLKDRVRDQQLDLEVLADQLRRRWPGVECKVFKRDEYNDGKPRKAIFIPIESHSSADSVFDPDVIQLGKPRSKLTKITRVHAIIKALQDECGGDVSIDAITERAMLDGIINVNELIDGLLRDSRIIKKRNGKYVVLGNMEKI